jgi:hypothetical protein
VICHVYASDASDARYQGWWGASLLAKQPPDALQHTVLLGIVGVVLGGDLEQRGESGRVCLDAVSYPLGDLGHVRLQARERERERTVWGDVCQATHMLVDEQDGNVLALRGEAVEGGLDGSVVRLCVDDEEVLLRVGRRRYVLGGVSVSVSIAAWPCISAAALTPTPASSMPVTVSCGGS